MDGNGDFSNHFPVQKKIWGSIINRKIDSQAFFPSREPGCLGGTQKKGGSNTENVSNEKGAPGCLVYIGDEKLPSYIGIIS